MSLSPAELNLINVAEKALEALPIGNPDDPNFDHTVACATLSSNGRVFTGLNLYHFTGGPCAEVVCFANAAERGVESISSASPGLKNPEAEKLVAVVAVGGKGRGVMSPCGRCRQIMVDFHPQIKAIVKTESGELKMATVRELLPFAYIASY